MLAMQKSELLLPVGNYQMCLAAIHNGADAVYLGMPEFNARGRTHDHSWEELREIIETCHLYGVAVHMAFNILIFEDELSKAIQVLDKAIALGPDALIIQDIGLIRLVRQRYPTQVIHASTQMTVTNHEAIDLLADLEIQRFVLGRENSLEEIKLIREKTDKELEVFVHGALCVAYSGQCFTSEALGGRSANRGQCAQSCRFDYELYVDGKKLNLVDKKYLVSPQDLCGIHEVETLQKIGVESFKVEGRLKSPQFVGTVAKSYKKAMNSKVTPDDLIDMQTTYSRGFYTGWLHGVAHQELVRGDYQSHRGYLVGEIKEIKKKSFIIETSLEMARGDGLLIVGQNIEVGEKIYQLKWYKNSLEVFLGPKVQVSKLKLGDKVYLNRKESLFKAVEQSIKNRDLTKKIPINIVLKGVVDQVLGCEVDDGQHQFCVFSRSKLEGAKKRALDENTCQKNMNSLAQTVYAVRNFSYQVEEDIFLNLRELKMMKQDMVFLLNHLRTQKRTTTPRQMSQPKAIENFSSDKSRLNIVLRKKDQLEALITMIEKKPHFRDVLNWVILDYEFGKDYFSSVRLLKEQNILCAIATTRILKPQEYHNFKLIDRCAPDGLLIRNLGALNFFQKSNYILLGDFSLNCANSESFNYLMSKGLSSQCASYDLNLKRLHKLIEHIDSSQLEITIHQYMPEFHMEHCVFAAFMSEGNSFRDCGKPCEKHEVYLKDMYGNRHEIKADQECRNTMFNSKAQSTIKMIETWKEKGVSIFRFEALHEDKSQLLEKLNLYFDYLSGNKTLTEVYDKIETTEAYGVDIGHLKFSKSYQSRKKF
ncbi:MAG: U32 family peptidase [Bacteriovoracaceae bacterium]|jgi:putative protease|nr:U32 family peptidase [Bacteriovoracaceae bacterium]